MSKRAKGHQALQRTLACLLLAGLISGAALAAAPGHAKPATAAAKTAAQPAKTRNAATGLARSGPAPKSAPKAAPKPTAKAAAKLAAKPVTKAATQPAAVASRRAERSKIGPAKTRPAAAMPAAKPGKAAVAKPLAKATVPAAKAKPNTVPRATTKAAAASATKPGKTTASPAIVAKTAPQPRRERMPERPKPALAARPVAERAGAVVAAVRPHVQTQPPLTIGPAAALQRPYQQDPGPGLPYPLGNGRVKPTPGTTVSEGYVPSGGLARRFIVIKPEPATEGAPVLVLLHATSMTPEVMANVTRAGRLAADYGAWVYLPEAIGAHWNDTPAALIGADDVAFIRTLIDTSVRSNRLDASRVFVAGYSNGGFMAERVACELSSRIAGGASIAATFRDAMAARCRPTHPMPFALFQGTADILVPYRGQLTLQGAREAFDQWGAYSDCRGPAATTPLPDVDPFDGTRVNLTRSNRCRNGSEIRLYTIENGGHTWPNSNYTLTTLELGLTTRDIDATTELWQFMTGFSLD